MKTVRLKDNIVAEIIPDYALPVEKWYGAGFAAQCVEAPDEVEQLWVYDPASGTFSAPGEEPNPEEATDLTMEDLAEAALDLETRLLMLEQMQA